MNQCWGCKYWRKLMHGCMACHYCIDNEKLRKRSGDVCLSKDTGGKRKNVADNGKGRKNVPHLW